MTHKPNYIDAIILLDSNAKCIYQNEDLSTLVWEDGNPSNITEKQITDKHAELITEYDAQEYARKRQAEYPPMADYLDAIVKGDDAQKQKYIDDCKAVKEKYPKWLILVAKMESVLVVNEYRTVVKKHTYSSGCS